MGVSNRPFRFYDNRQKYLGFVNTCDEKWQVGKRCALELRGLIPKPPALRVFDAGMGDGTVLTHIMRAMHREFPTIPFFIVGKEISLEDVRLSLDKLPDRFVEHPATTMVFTNLFYAEAPWLKPNKLNKQTDVNWIQVTLKGDTAHGFGEQLRNLDEQLIDGWQVKASERSGNPIYVKPTVLVIYREDQKFILNDIIPRYGKERSGNYDLIVISQPWRARMDADFKVKRILAPLVKSLAKGGKALVFQSIGGDPGMDIVRNIWPDEDPFEVDRHTLIKTLKSYLGNEKDEYSFINHSDEKALFKYKMHTLPDEIGDSIGTSTLFAAWNAAIYVAQIEDERLEPVASSGEYLEITSSILQKYKGLWFNDEAFSIFRKID